MLGDPEHTTIRKQVPQELSKSVSIVGLGRVGTALAVALADAGYSLGSLISKRPVAAKKTLKRLNCPAQVMAIRSLAQLDGNAVIIATPDDQIAGVAKSLAELRINSNRKRVVLHTSGALSSSILAPLAEKGWQTGSLHPLVAVGDLKVRENIFRSSYWCVEGDPAAARLAKRLIRDLEGHTFSVNAKQKPLYHAAAVMAAGNLVALLSVATNLLNQCGIKEELGRRILEPLAGSALHNFSNDPKHALTGPFARGDLATVSLHLQSLSTPKTREARALYTLLGMRSIELAEAMGLDKKKARALKDLLEQ